MEIMSSFGTRISLMMADPLETTLNVTSRGLPEESFPSQVPGMLLMEANAFWASVCATAAAAASAIAMRAAVRIDFFMTVSFRWDGHCPSRNSFGFAGGGFRRFSLPCMLGFDERFQVVQAGGPEDSVLLDPGIDGAQRLGIEFIHAVPAFAMLAHQMSTAEEAQVLRDRRTGNGKGAGDLPCGLRTTAEEIEDGAAGGIGKSLEGSLAGPGRGICNRSVTHNV